MIHLGDITKINGAAVPVVDVVTGGSPCQDLSIAGKRQGLDGNRSGLFMEQVRIVKEMRENDRSAGRTDEYIRPRYMVWENVPGAFSSNRGEDFRTVLEEIARIVQEDAVIPRPAKNWGGQEPSWVMGGALHGEFMTHSFGEFPKEENESLLSQILEVTPHQKYSLSAKACLGILRRAEKRGKQIIDVLRTALEMQSASLSDPDALGGGKGILVQKERTATLSTVNNQAVLLIENHPNNSRVKIREDGKCQTLTGRMGTGGGNVPMVLEQVFCIGNGQVDQLKPSKLVGALNCMHEQQAVMTGGIIRRLTPLECERLQGFPDYWTDIGEWTDSRGKKHKPSDSPRYKALGNSIALPFWEWMARRIAAQYERPLKMGSLFDGIGGFPLAFQRAGGKAVWASEIEEFPIAVTKHHFGEE